MDEAKKSAVSNLVLNDETVYEFNNNALASPDSPSLSSAAVVSQINEDVAKLQQSQNKPTAHHLHSPANHVVSEKVQNLAAQIYTELQRVIMSNNDDDDIVSGLMPLIVNVLESLDLQLIETQQLQVELELMKDDNDQLISAFEKEKAVKKRLEQQLFEYEFHSDEEKQKLNQKINSLESIVKMMELKSKNANDSVTRLEDEKNEIKSEFNNLHHRNNELLRSYWDLMERVKLLIGSDDVSNLASLNLNEIRKNVANVLDENLNDVTAGRNIQLEKPSQTAINSNYNLNELMSMENMDDNASLNDVSISLADEIKQADKDSLVGQFVNPSDYASINDNYGLNGMEKEVENLIKENNELLATKNALNIVKDDLIAQVDDLQSKLTLREAENMQMLKIQEVLKQKVDKIEEELKKTLTTNETLKQKLAQKNDDSEEGVPMAQRKRFTRNEMARVLMEKNQLKERLIELQESVKWTDSVIKQNNNRLEQAQKERSSIWKFGKNLSSFSSFFTNPSQMNTSGNMADLTNVKYQNSNDEVNLDFDSSSRLRGGSNIPALESMRRRVKQQQQKSTVQNELMVFLDNDLYSEMKKMNRKGSQVNSNSIVAYGWCLQQKSDNDNVITHPVPVPIHCRPLATSSQNSSNNQPHSTGLRIWCAAAVDLSGGEAGFPRSKSTLDTTGSSSGKEVAFDSDMPAELRNLPPEYKLSTLTWICSVSHSRSKITIVNMKSSPSEILDSFFVKTHLFCICSVPGAKNDDTILDLSQEDLAARTVLCERTFAKKSNVTKPAELEEPKKAAASVEDSSQDKLSNYLNYYKKSPSTEQDETSPKEDERTDETDDGHKPMSTVLPTMFAGGQNGRIYMYSSVTQWSELIDYVDLSDSVLSINHYRGKILASLANGELCVFSRDQEGGEWNLRNYIVVNLNNCLNLDADLSPTNESANGKANKKVYPIRCSTVAGSNIWVGYRNLVIIFRIDDLKLLNVHAAHSTNEEQVRLLATLSYNDEADQFVICILRLDCVIRIYQNYAPFDCIYTVDLEPTINKFLVCNLSNQRGQRDSQQFSEQELSNKVGVGVINFIRFTAMKVTENRIWLGTANGVILTIPHLFDAEKCRPKLILQDTQLSYHGHKDAVKFIVASKNYCMSGGEGYTDFRLEQQSEFGLGSVLSKTDQNHLILWETNMS